ncbi:MAG: autotransporter outer membrane beta-barrel domain-containing protein, partial [Methyloligellaceae bacterium]
NPGEEDVGRNFANTRANIIVSNGPDLGPIHNRLTNSQTSNQSTALSAVSGTQALAIGGPTDGELASAQTSGAMFLTGSDLKSNMRLPVNIWVQGQPIYFEDDTGGGDRDGHAGLGFLGGDVLVGSSVLLGIMAQFDWIDESSPVSDSKIDGEGWMVGPYVSVRLLPQVFLDARAAWGQSSNTVDWLATNNRDKFDTDRMLLSARLSATLRKPDMPNMRIAPSVSVSYFDETQHSYNSAQTGFVPEQDISLGRATIGTEFGYTFDNADGTKIEPLIAIKGIWDFEKDDITTIGGQVVSPNDVRGLVEAGATITSSSGLTLRATGSYDGIGDDDFEAYKGQLFVIMPFN